MSKKSAKPPTHDILLIRDVFNAESIMLSNIITQYIDKWFGSNCFCLEDDCEQCLRQDYSRKLTAYPYTVDELKDIDEKFTKLKTMLESEKIPIVKTKSIKNKKLS